MSKQRLIDALLAMLVAAALATGAVGFVHFRSEGGYSLLGADFPYLWLIVCYALLGFLLGRWSQVPSEDNLSLPWRRLRLGLLLVALIVVGGYALLRQLS